MTARHHIRFGSRRLTRDGAAIDATPAPRLGEVLQLARENKGVDLFRAERDTKIRLRYLAALEDSDFDELPAAVYTKGFLRNYAIYLGLDPEDVLLRWREEMQIARDAERPAVAPPPRPLTAPRRGPAITPGLVMAILLSLAVVGFMAFIAVQLLRFADVPAVSITNPRALVSHVNSESIILTGTSAPGALVRIVGPGGELFNTTANESGEWSLEVPLARGRNDFVVSAVDPVTRRDSEPVNLIVTVPLPAQSAAPSASPQAPAAIDLSVISPPEGAVAASGTLTVSGSTSATRLTIVSQYLGPAPSGSPSAATPSPALESPAAGSPTAGPVRPTAAPIDLTVPTTGRFSQQLALAPGRWSITITASSAGVQPRTLVRTVTVGAPSDLIVEILVTGQASWLRVVADGEVVRGYGGRTVRAGETHTLTAGEEIWLRAGNAGALTLKVNGQDMGRLGKGGQVGNWIIRAGQPPERTTERR